MRKSISVSRVPLAFAAVALPLLAGLSSAACKDTYEDAYPDSATFCSQKAQDECTTVAERCVVPNDRCVSARTAACANDANVATATGRHYIPSFAQACLDQTRSLYANATLAPFELAARDDVCAHVFQGVAAKGQTCRLAYDCAGALICDKERCAQLVQKSLGDGCANAGEVCIGGTYCGPSNGVMQCIPAKQAGQGCSALEPCDDSLRCTGGACSPRVGLGQPCTTSADCASTAPYCDAAAQNRCDTGITLAPGAIACKDFGAGPI